MGFSYKSGLRLHNDFLYNLADQIMSDIGEKPKNMQ